MNWRKYILLGLLSSLLLSVSWPIYGFAWLSFIALVPLLWGLSKVSFNRFSKTSISLTTMLFISMWIFIVCHWVHHASWTGLIISTGFGAITMSVPLIYYHYISKKVLGLIIFITCWLTVEYFHLHTDSGMPWMILGNIFSNHPEWIQWYEYTGTLGGSLWVLTTNALLFLALQNLQAKQFKKGKVMLSMYLGLILLPIGVSQYYLNDRSQTHGETTIMLTQPNIDPYHKKYRVAPSSLVQLLLESLEGHDLHKIDWIITPETYISRPLNLDHFYHYNFIKNLVGSLEKYPNLNIILGSDGYRFLNPNKHDKLYYNTAIQLATHTSDTLQSYHKSKLLLGVETLPYRDLLKPFESILLNFGGTITIRKTQENRTVFLSKDQKKKMAPIICWESIFGEFVTDYVKKGANFLGVLSNDAWWSNSQGHKQLLAYSRLRAIETRRYLVRAVNTGISAVINEKGIIEKQLPYNTKGTIQATIPLLNGITYYVKYGDYLGRLSILMTFLFLFYQMGSKLLKRKQFFL